MLAITQSGVALSAAQNRSDVKERKTMTNLNKTSAVDLSRRTTNNGSTAARVMVQRFLWLVAVFLLVPGAARAQQITASISGNVTDENKSLIPNASVSVESPPLAVRRSTTTSDEGFFIVTNLP